MIHLPALADRLETRFQRTVIGRRPPDLVIGGWDDPYLLRWYLIQRNPVANAYLHCFERSDDDRALHDHPWPSLSLMLRGTAIEHTIAAGGIHRRRILTAGDLVYRSPRHAHRIELHAGKCMTLFLTGPRLREWGFHCPERGWVPWREFTGEDGTTIGKGCDP